MPVQLGQVNYKYYKRPIKVNKFNKHIKLLFNNKDPFNRFQVLH